jgi:alpha-beta hydrolase superfamily lysophospholipase
MGKSIAKRKLPSFIRWILWVVLVQFILINISAAFYAYRLTHFYENTSLQKEYHPAGNIFVKTWRLFTGPRQFKSINEEVPAFSYDTVTLTTKKGMAIDAWYCKTDSAAKGTVLLFHGISMNKGYLLHEAYEFRYQGYNVMLVDFRAHGKSAGNVTTIGVNESEEVKLSYDYVTKKGEKNIFLWGASMGAVVVAKSIADYQLQPAGVILEMPFASMSSYLKARARILGFPEQPFSFLTTSWISIERGVNGFSHQTYSYVQKINCPVLMQWGALDNVVLREETDKVYNHIASANKKLVIYDYAGHESLLQNDAPKWRNEVESFFAGIKRK